MARRPALTADQRASRRRAYGVKLAASQLAGNDRVEIRQPFGIFVQLVAQLHVARSILVLMTGAGHALDSARVASTLQNGLVGSILSILEKRGGAVAEALQRRRGNCTLRHFLGQRSAKYHAAGRRRRKRRKRTETWRKPVQRRCVDSAGAASADAAMPKASPKAAREFRSGFICSLQIGRDRLDVVIRQARGGVGHGAHASARTRVLAIVGQGLDQIFVVLVRDRRRGARAFERVGVAGSRNGGRRRPSCRSRSARGRRGLLSARAGAAEKRNKPPDRGRRDRSVLRNRAHQLVLPPSLTEIDQLPSEEIFILSGQGRHVGHFGHALGAVARGANLGLLLACRLIGCCMRLAGENQTTQRDKPIA